MSRNERLPSAQPVHALGHDPDGIDVQAGIGLVHDRDGRLEQRHLQDVHALLLAAREPDVEGPLHDVLADLEGGGGFVDLLHEGRCRQLLLAALLALRVQRRAKEGHGADAGNLDRILEGQEHAGGGALLGRHLEDVLSIEDDLAALDVVVRLAGDDIGQRRLAGTVRPHDRGDLAVPDGEIEVVEDGVALDGDGEVSDVEHGWSVSSGLFFAPCGEKAALAQRGSDEGSGKLNGGLPTLIRHGFAATPSPAKGEGTAEAS